MELLRKRGILSEFSVYHPELPFKGIIDLVEFSEGTVTVVDFKTGVERDKHRYQIKLYGILWWRKTGVFPETLAIQYLNRRVEHSASKQGLLAAEDRLRKSIADARQLLAETPAAAQPSGDCQYCPARARCDEGWRSYQVTQGRAKQGTADVELTVITEPSPVGFLAKLNEQEVNIVYSAAIGAGLPSIECGQNVRLVDVLVLEGGATLEIKPWTEAFPI